MLQCNACGEVRLAHIQMFYMPCIPFHSVFHGGEYENRKSMILYRFVHCDVIDNRQFPVYCLQLHIFK